MAGAQLFVVVLAGLLAYVTLLEGVVWIAHGGWEHGVMAALAFVALCAWVWMSAFRKPKWRKPHSR